MVEVTHMFLLVFLKRLHIPYFTVEAPMSNKRPPPILAKKSCVGLIALELAPLSIIGSKVRLIVWWPRSTKNAFLKSRRFVTMVLFTGGCLFTQSHADHVIGL